MKKEEYELIEKNIDDSIICVEKYITVDKNLDNDIEETYHICIFSYFIDINQDNIIKMNVFLKLGNRIEWTQFRIEANLVFTPWSITINIPEVNEIYNKASEKIVDFLKSSLLELFNYIKGKKSKKALIGENFKENWEIYTLNAVGDATMFVLNSVFGNRDSEKENKIKDADSRRVPNSKDTTNKDNTSEAIIKIIENIRKNQEEEDKKKKDSTYKYTKLEPSTPSTFNTPDVVKAVLSKMAIPTKGLTVQNIELDGAFRISFT